MGMRVGIDPTGGTDAFSPNVVWSTPFDTYDTWGLYSVETTAAGSTVTVFTRSTPHYGFEHNDIYVDDASLVEVGAGGGGNGQPVVVPPAPPPQPTATQVTGFPYVVVRGDNYYRIALRFGVTLSALLAANPVANPNILFVGAVLIIPSDNPPPDNGGQGNPIDNTQPPAPPAPPAPTPTTPPSQLPGAFAYVVQPGDNLFRIGLRFGVSVARIKQLNGLVSDIIFVGQTLIIAP
jgi:LysM repeat protein